MTPSSPARSSADPTTWADPRRSPQHDDVGRMHDPRPPSPSAPGAGGPRAPPDPGGSFGDGVDAVASRYPDLHRAQLLEVPRQPWPGSPPPPLRPTARRAGAGWSQHVPPGSERCDCWRWLLANFIDLSGGFQPARSPRSPADGARSVVLSSSHSSRPRCGRGRTVLGLDATRRYAGPVRRRWRRSPHLDGAGRQCRTTAWGAGPGPSAASSTVEAVEGPPAGQPPRPPGPSTPRTSVVDRVGPVGRELGPVDQLQVAAERRDFDRRQPASRLNAGG